MSLETRKDPKISVVGQMTLLRGYSQMMAMLKPWKDTRFDQSLGKIRIQEDNTLTLFPKNELFKVPLGLGAAILRNLPKRQLALLDDKDNVYISSGNFEDVDSSAAALIGFDRLGPKTTVTIEDIAQSILGLTEFLKEIEDITQFDDKEVKEALVELDQKRPLLNKLIVGLSTFASKYLLAKDGSFYSAINIKTKTVDKTVRLSDQILMQQALLALADYSGAELPRLQVLDNIFYLNRNLWNPNSGFYITSNRPDANSNIQLVDVVRSINNFEKLKGHLESLTNAKSDELNPVEITSSLTSLQSFWVKRFFSPQVKSLPKAALVLSFK